MKTIQIEYFKSDKHKQLFKEMINKLGNPLNDKEYVSLAYLLSATEKKGIVNALGDHRIDTDKLLAMSGVYSTSEKALIELAFQMFGSRNLYIDEEDTTPKFPTISHIMDYLGSENKRVVLEAMMNRFI